MKTFPFKEGDIVEQVLDIMDMENPECRIISIEKNAEYNSYRITHLHKGSILNMFYEGTFEEVVSSFKILKSNIKLYGITKRCKQYYDKI